MQRDTSLEIPWQWWVIHWYHEPFFDWTEMPFDVCRIDSVVVAQQAAHDEGKRRLILADPDPLSCQILRPADAAIGSNIDRGMPEATRRKHRNRDVGEAPAGYGDQRVGKWQFRNVELRIAEDADEELVEGGQRVANTTAMHSNAAVDERPDAIVVPGRDAELDG